MNARHASPEIDGARLRELRQISGLSVTDAAKKIGITIGYLSQIERGDRPTVSPRMFNRICDAMGIGDRASLLRSHEDVA